MPQYNCVRPGCGHPQGIHYLSKYECESQTWMYGRMRQCDCPKFLAPEDSGQNPDPTMAAVILIVFVLLLLFGATRKKRGGETAS